MVPEQDSDVHQTVSYNFMAKNGNLLKGLQSPATVVSIDRDLLYEEERREALKQIEQGKAIQLEGQKALQRAWAQENKEQGIPPAYIDSDDLVGIINIILGSGCAVTKAFEQWEAQQNKCVNWAKRTIKRIPDANDLKDAIASIEAEQNAQLSLIQTHGLFDLKLLVKSNSYSEALTRLRNKMAAANRFQAKVDEIAKLEAQKAACWGQGDLTQKVHTLNNLGVSVKQIADQLGIARGTVYNHLNKTPASSP